MSFGTARTCPAARRCRPRSARRFGEANRSFLAYPERAAKIKVAFGTDNAAGEQGWRERWPRHAVLRRRRPLTPRAACRRSRRTCRRPPVAGCRPAATRALPVCTLQAMPSFVDRALGLQGDDRGLRVGLVAILDRGLRGAELGGVHLVLSRILLRSDVPGQDAYVTIRVGGAFCPTTEICFISTG